MRHIKGFEQLNEKVATLYHGSPHEFDSFTTDHIGTGEGNRIFGWGLYFSDSEDIALDYAWKLTSNKYQTQWHQQIALYREKYPMLNLTSSKLCNEIRQFQAGKITDKIKQALINQIIQHTSPSNKWVHDDEGEIVKESDYVSAKAKEFMDEIISSQNYKSIIYSVKADLNKAKWLDWYEKPTEDDIERVKSQAEKENIGITFKDSSAYGRTITYGIFPKGFEKELKEGSDLYSVLIAWLGSDKEASLFLLRSGIHGVRYPANSIATGNFAYMDDTAKNYVVFNNNILKKTSKKIISK
jgi:hypothetical protein